MFVGFSQSLGKGLRIHIGTRIGSKKLTQAELAKQEKKEFLKRVSEISELSLGSFLQDCGYNDKTIIYITKNGSLLDSSEFFTIEANNTLFNELASIQQDIKTLVDKANFSGVLSSSTREKLTDKIFDIFSLVSKAQKEPDPNNRILNIINEKQLKNRANSTKNISNSELPTSKKVVFGVLFGTIALLALIGTLIFSDKGKDISIIIFMCIVFFSPLLARTIFYKK